MTGENYLLVGTTAPWDSRSTSLRNGHSDYSRLADVLMGIRLRDDGTVGDVDSRANLAAEGTSDIADRCRRADQSAYRRDENTAARAARLIDTVEENLGIPLSTSSK